MAAELARQSMRGLVSRIALLAALQAVAHGSAAGEIARDFHFISADFITSEPYRVGWLDEERVIFSVGGVLTISGTECGPKPNPRCNQKRSIQVWDITNDRLETFMDGALLHCIAAGRIAVVAGAQYHENYHTGRIGHPLADTGLSVGGTYDWDGCTPAEPTRTVGKDGVTVLHVKERWDFFDFKGAYFRATRFGYPRARIFWKAPNGSEQSEELPDGPWNESGRLSEWYTPTKVGVIVTDGPRSYFVDAKGYSTFFPGSISSTIGVSPSGCGVSFFGATFSERPRKTEVRLRVIRLC
jgi:hypothetical protein